MKTDIYLYGMVLATTSFLLKDGFIQPDEYSEIKAKYQLPGGETGTCATVLASLGTTVRVDGNHIGTKVAPVLRNFYRNKSVILDSLFFDEKYEGLEDYVIIADDVRSPMGTFGEYHNNSIVKRYNMPKEEDIAACTTAAIDPYFKDATRLAAEYCVKHKIPYVTIDCAYDSYLHKNAAVTVISGEGIKEYCPGKTRDEVFPYYQQNSDGLTIISNGSKPFYYGRKGEERKIFTPYKVNVVSTLGAGDTFKAGCTYALNKKMSDDELVRFASACSAVAITRFPLPLYPPVLDEVYKMMEGR